MVLGQRRADTRTAWRFVRRVRSEDGWSSLTKASFSVFLAALLVASLAMWHRTMGTVSIASIHSRQAETFYWLTIMSSQTLGTALGDWMADSTGLGYAGGPLVFDPELAPTTAVYLYTNT